MNELKNADCKNVAVILHGLQFANAEPRKERLTAEQANAIRAKAHELGLHSIALAQAFQFDCGLRQKDVTGEWVPISDSVTSEIIRGTQKWARGIRWSEIDDNLVLRHVPSIGGNEVELHLTDFPMVMDELRRLGKRPKSGPIIIHDDTKQPYLENAFRLAWRKAADAAGVPKTVYNRDSRASTKRGQPAAVNRRAQKN